MTYGGNYPGQAYFGGNNGTLYAQQKIEPSEFDAGIIIHTPLIENTQDFIRTPVLDNPITLYVPVIYGATTIITPDALPASTIIYKPKIIGELAPNDTAPSWEFYRRTFLPIREIIAGVQISFIKGYDPDADFYIVGSSAFDSGDVWQGNGSAIQEWDKFFYTDYSDYLRSLTYSYEQDVLGSMILGYADVTLDNIGDTFSPYGESDIADLILPYRPMKIYTGFKQQPYQVFVGQTVRLPKADNSKAQFHAMDFIASFADIEITDGLTFVAVTTDEVIDYVLQNYAGLSPTQYTLDVGLNTISFLHVAPGTKIGKLFRDLVQAEQGRIYQRADGEIRFDNRNNKLRPTALTIRDEYVFLEKEPDASNVINRVVIESDVREVQSSQQVYPGLKDGSLTDYEDFASFKIAPGETVEKFFNLKDPVTSYTHPTVGGGITANSASDGSGTNQNAALSRTVLSSFTDAVKYSFHNSSGADIYVIAVTIQGTPAIVVEEIRIDESDATSIGKYGEQLLTLKNNYFTDKAYAQTIAEEIVALMKDAPNTREITVKGIPYAAVADVITYYDGLTYVIDYIGGKISPSDGMVQDWRLRRVDLP